MHRDRVRRLEEAAAVARFRDWLRAVPDRTLAGCIDPRAIAWVQGQTPARLRALAAGELTPPADIDALLCEGVRRLVEAHG